MKTKNILTAFIIIGILGSLSHFVYEWSGNNRFVGYFFAVNESTWEHLKLLFFPTFVYSVIEYFFVKNKIANYIPAAVISVFVGMVTIVTLFYTYKGVLGYSIDAINIIIYYIGLAVMLAVKNLVINSEILSGKNFAIVFLTLALLQAILFFRFSYYPPTLGIFNPPVKS